jgi:hypothetical protein
VSESVADVLERVRAGVLERPVDRQRFLEAALVLLALDPEVKRLPYRQRAKLISSPISTADANRIVDALKNAIQRVMTENPDPSKLAPDPVLLRRILAACAVTKGLPPNQDRRSLSEVTHLLRDIWDDAEKAARQGNMRKARQLSSTRQRPGDMEWVEKIQREATDLQLKNPNQRQADRLRILYRRSRSRWPSPNALRAWANRHAIKI